MRVLLANSTDGSEAPACAPAAPATAASEFAAASAALIDVECDEIALDK
jgi:hypothetical protein